MERNWELVRKVLLKLEEQATSTGHLTPDSIDGYDADLVSYHMELMDGAGLIRARCSKAMNRPTSCVGLSLTWEGHELLDRIRTDSMWNRIKGMAREKGVDLSVDVIKLAAKSLLEAMF